MKESDGPASRFSLVIKSGRVEAPPGAAACCGASECDEAGPAVPWVTVDPSLPPETQALLREAGQQMLRDPDRSTAWYGPSGLGVLLPLSVGAQVFLVPEYRLGDPFTVVLLCYVVGALSTVTVGPVRKWRRARRQLPVVRSVRDRYVLSDDLVPEAAALLARASRAVDTVLGSTVHQQDLVVDRQRNNVVLPAQRWVIADLLRDYSRVLTVATQEVQGDEARPVLDAHHTALRTSLHGIERRVAALETYAAQAVAADRLYSELRQVEQLQQSGGELLDLLARTAGDDMAVAELDRLTEHTSTAAESLRSALDAARTSALGLPEPTSYRPGPTGSSSG